MLVGKLLERVRSGEKIQNISAEIGVNPATVRRKLNQLGYTWDNRLKAWKFEGDGDQPLNVNIIDLMDKKKVKLNPAAANDPAPEEDNDHDPLDRFDYLIKPKSVKNNKIQRGFYLDPDIAKALDKHIPIKNKSEFVNDAIKYILKAKGLL